MSADDRISSENYSQHAEHFYRVMASQAENQNQKEGQKSSAIRTENIDVNSEPKEQDDGGEVKDQNKENRGRRSRKNSRYDKVANNKNFSAAIESVAIEDQPNITEKIEAEPSTKLSIDVADI